MKMGTILIVVGAVLIVGGVLLNFSQHKTQTTQNSASLAPEVSGDFRETQIPASPDSSVVGSAEPRAALASDPSVKEDSSPSNVDKDFKKIGNDFEGFVADILKANDIRLKQWNQGSTSPEGAYAENELNPDFFVSHKDGKNPLEYWVECKYRSNLPNSGFSLEEYQLNRYYSIQGKSKRKIVIALGVGGTPTSPADFYIIPLDTIYRFKRIGKKFLPNYVVSNPRANFKTHISDWFFNDVFKKKNSSK